MKRDVDTIVVALDGHWTGSIKQSLAYILGRLNFTNLFFTHAWVSGTLQYQYARMLGFKSECIAFDLYSADTKIFHKAYIHNLPSKEKKIPS